MQITPLHSLKKTSRDRRPVQAVPVVRDTVPTSQLPHFLEGWIFNGEYRDLSKATITNRRQMIGNLIWWLNSNECEFCGSQELRRFQHYLQHGGRDSSKFTGPGRFGRPDKARGASNPIRPTTIRSYHAYLASFFQWMVKERHLTVNPMNDVENAGDPHDEVQPFTDSHIDALRKAAKRTKYPKRDYALILFMHDTGLRSEEVCKIKIGDLDLTQYEVSVIGKGKKRRPVCFGAKTRHAIRDYLWDRFRAVYESGENPDPAWPLFESERGITAGGMMSTSGLRQLYERLGEMAKITGVRCSPHTMRHTFAIDFLRSGGSELALQKMLGHSCLDMTRRYCQIAKADIREQHRRHSPVDRK